MSLKKTLIFSMWSHRYPLFRTTGRSCQRSVTQTGHRIFAAGRISGFQCYKRIDFAGCELDERQKRASPSYTGYPSG